MNDKGIINRLEETHAEHKEKNYEELPWRAWGSWFSWGSPVGMGIGWTLFILPLGAFLVMLHQIGILK